MPENAASVSLGKSLNMFFSSEGGATTIISKTPGYGTSGDGYTLVRYQARKKGKIVGFSASAR